MTHVLIIFEAVEPGNIESRRILKLLEAKGKLESRWAIASHMNCDDLIWSDVLIFIRSTSSIERDISILAKKMGKFVILSIDDDFLSLSESYGVDGAGYRTNRHKCLKDILKVIDCLTTVNELLAQKYIKLCHTDRYAVTNTIVEKNELFPTSQDGKPKEKIKLAIYVNDGSQGLFNHILRPALQRLPNNYQKRIVLYLMALHPDMSDFHKLIETHYVPHLPYLEFKSYLGKEGFDIGLAPLTDTGFSKYKYFNKYIEYTLAGIPAIYSDCQLYRLVIKDKYNGIITKNSPDDWCRAIVQMVDDAALRKTLIDNAQKHLYENFNSNSILEKLLLDIPEFVGYKSENNTIKFLKIRLLFIKIKYIVFRIRGWGGTATTMIKKGNYMLFWQRFRKRILKA